MSDPWDVDPNSELIDSAMKKEKAKPDWSRFGLDAEQQKESEAGDQEVFEHHGNTEKNELYREDQSAHSKPWWKANFFISEPVLFGTWDGVFTSCMINIFGVVIFLRTGWMVGNAGIGFSVLIIFMTISVALVAALSAIGVCERCKMESGGVYFLMSHVMGARIGASVGIIYCFGMAVACSLYTVGFGEAISDLFNADNVWISRGIAIGVVLLLLCINIAGVKWVIRLQLILLMVLFVAMLDFLVGSFVHDDPDNGFMGYDTDILKNNTGPDYLEDEHFFTVFGVFFPTATGVFAGINMSGDLRNPSRNIPVGTLSAVGVSTFLYLIFAIVLGATCIRYNLQHDYMIAEVVSVVGFLFLAGLYISSISSCMGGLYGAPRILQSIANDEIIPFLRPLGKGRGPNKVPVYALIVTTAITLIFILIGEVNTLGPIVTMPFMLTYACVDYAYFALAMSYDKKKAREARFQESHLQAHGVEYTDLQKGKDQSANYGTIEKKGDDLDNLFPERVQPDQRGQMQRQNSLGSPTFYSETGKVVDGTECKDLKSETMSLSQASEVDDTAELIKKSGTAGPRPSSAEITRQPRSFYSLFCNRWLSVLGGIISLVIMFFIQWGYALAVISVVLVIYLYIGQVNPGVFPGIADFSIVEWIRDSFRRCCRKGPPPPEQIVVTPNTPAMNTMAAQLTEDNEDFAERGRYHQSEVVKGDNFDDYDSD